MRSGQYYDPWAKVGQSLNDSMFKYLSSRPSPTEQAAAQAEVGAKNALARKYELEGDRLQDQRDASTNIAGIFGDITNTPMEAPAPSPEFVGPGMGVAPDAATVQERYTQNMPDIFANAMRFAGDKPGSLGDVFMAMAASGGSSPEQLTRAQMGSGMDYANTKPGFEADLNQGYSLTPGAIRFTSDHKKVASAPFKPEGGGFYMQLPDGTVVQQGGGQMKLNPTKTVTNNLQGQQVASAKLRGLINYTRDLANKDPMNFGFPGFVKGQVQDVTSLLQGISQTMGYDDSQGAVVDTQREIARSGIDPTLLSGVFDPDLPALHTASDLLVFQAASALAGQEGRSVSDRDVKYFKTIVGDPTSLFSNQQKFLSKLDTIEQILSINENVADTSLGGNVTGTASGQQPSGQAPAVTGGGWSEQDESRLQELEAKYRGQ